MFVPEDHDLRFVCVEFQAIVPHPVGDAGPAFVEVRSGGDGVL